MIIFGEVCILEADDEEDEAGEAEALSETSWVAVAAATLDVPVVTGEDVMVTLPGGNFRTVKLRFNNCVVRWGGNCLRPPGLTTILRICGLSVDIKVAFGLLIICICGKFFVCTFMMLEGRVAVELGEVEAPWFKACKLICFTDDAIGDVVGVVICVVGRETKVFAVVLGFVTTTFVYLLSCWPIFERDMIFGQGFMLLRLMKTTLPGLLTCWDCKNVPAGLLMT